MKRSARALAFGLVFTAFSLPFGLAATLDELQACIPTQAEIDANRAKFKFHYSTPMEQVPDSTLVEFHVAQCYRAIDPQWCEGRSDVEVYDEFVRHLSALESDREERIRKNFRIEAEKAGLSLPDAELEELRRNVPAVLAELLTENRAGLLSYEQKEALVRDLLPTAIRTAYARMRPVAPALTQDERAAAAEARQRWGDTVIGGQRVADMTDEEVVAFAEQPDQPSEPTITAEQLDRFHQESDLYPAPIAPVRAETKPKSQPVPVAQSTSQTESSGKPPSIPYLLGRLLVPLLALLYVIDRIKLWIRRRQTQKPESPQKIEQPDLDKPIDVEVIPDSFNGRP